MNARTHPRTASGNFNKLSLPEVLPRGCPRGLTTPAAFSICRRCEAVSSQLDLPKTCLQHKVGVDSVDLLWAHHRFMAGQAAVNNGVGLWDGVKRLIYRAR